LTQVTTALNTYGVPTQRLYDVVEATSPAQMHALAHLVRHKILRELSLGAATISQLSKGLGINKGSISHHLGVLVRAGLVRKGATRTVRGGTEQYFVRTARKYRFDPASTR
jgi:DNA-binding transcriptional ArsR family regulator